MTPSDTARIHFRPMTAGDLDRMAGLLGDPQVMAYYPAPKTREQARAWIDRNTTNYADHGYGLWVIETLARDVLGSPELVAIIHPANTASRRVAEKIGMRPTAEERSGAPPVRVVYGMRLAPSP